MSGSSDKTLVQFGAGNIGRSFIGQVFSRNGWKVVFVDVNQSLIDELNRRGEYRVHIKRNDEEDQILRIQNIRAVSGLQERAVIEELLKADMVSTSVGSGILPRILPVISKALILRSAPVNLILAENIRNGADLVRREMKSLLPEDYPLESRLGLVETSIGKMVPIMTKEDLAKDPLAVYAEEYNNLIVDKHGFIGEIPDFRELKAVDDIKAYVDRKLFIHNLGHAASAYLGFRKNPEFRYIWEVLESDEIFREVKAVMTEAANALYAEYPRTFARPVLEEHIDDLLYRFKNKSLGDTVFRVGRDLYRKLSPSDRILGALRLAEKHGLPCRGILDVARAACCFQGVDDQGNLFEQDRQFCNEFAEQSPDQILAKLTG
ncbi:MAG: mannitol-1-phosphate 5-dehydrogenase [Spirochaetales bacterium]|nr:mannitol-1-phosphate 5-dehydrogenase [Spirochaetales bacterium]